MIEWMNGWMDEEEQRGMGSATVLGRPATSWVQIGKRLACFAKDGELYRGGGGEIH